MKNFLHKAVFAACALGISAGAMASAASFPDKPIRFVVPAGAGGPTEIVARMVAEGMAQNMGVPVIVEAKPGAGGNIGADFVARAEPDGYTILMGTIGTHAVNQSLYAKLPFDPINDFEPVSLLISYPLVVVTNPSLPITSIKELVEYAKAHPNKLNRAHGGSGTSMHLSGELFNMMAGIKMQHIPYKGSAPALADIVGGQADLGFDSIVVAKPLIDAGKLRAIGVTSLKPSDALPGVPPVSDTVSGYEMTSWIGVLAPAGTPKPIVDRLQKAIAAALQAPKVAEHLNGLAATPIGSTPEEFRAHIRSETDKWAPVVRETGATVN